MGTSHGEAGRYTLEQTVVRSRRIMIIRDEALDIETYVTHEVIGSEFSNTLSNRIGRKYFRLASTAFLCYR
jgi:hypothetical protein